MGEELRFARCQECGNTETFVSDPPWCDGAGDGIRRHPRTRTVEVSGDDVLAVYGVTDKSTAEQRTAAATEAATALGLGTTDEDGTFNADASAFGGATAEGEATTTADPVPVDEQTLEAAGWTRNEAGGWNPPAEVHSAGTTERPFA